MVPVIRFGVNPKGIKLLALALDPSAAPGEMQAAAIKFIELARKEGCKTEDILGHGKSNGHGPSATWIGEKMVLLRDVAHWKSRAEAAEKSVGAHVMRVRFLEDRCNQLAKEADRLKLIAEGVASAPVSAPVSAPAHSTVARTPQHGHCPLRFGKYKGKPVNAVPSHYLRWCLNNLSRLRPEERYTFEGVLAERQEFPELEMP